MDPEIQNVLLPAADLLKQPSRGPGARPGRPLDRYQGTVDAIVSANTVNLKIRGAASANAFNITTLVSCAVGDTVWILDDNGDLLVIGVQSATYLKSFWLPAKLFDIGLGGPTYVVAGGWAAMFFSWNLRHGFQDGVVCTTEVPWDYAGGVIQADVHYQGGGAGNFRLDGQGKAIASGTPGGTVADSGAATGSVTVSSYNGYAVTAALFNINTPITAGGLITMVLDRNGTHAADTSTNVMFFLGIRLNYLAKRT